MVTGYATAAALQMTVSHMALAVMATPESRSQRAVRALEVIYPG